MDSKQELLILEQHSADEDLIGNEIIFVDKLEELLQDEDICFHYQKMNWHRRQLEKLIKEKGDEFTQ